MQASLGLVDAFVLIFAIAIATGIGLRASSKNTSVEAFLLGDRNLPWWTILGSIVATEASTATVLSLPATAFGPTGMKFLQLAFGYILGRTIVVYFLLPRSSRGSCLARTKSWGRDLVMPPNALLHCSSWRLKKNCGCYWQPKKTPI